jgi:glutamate formiminotransferase/formiminotetrahydrofolate cyclodeaminase
MNVTGSEVVGLIPKEALVMAGKFYLRERTPNIKEDEYIARAIEALGLSQLERFDPKKKIIEYMI